MEASNMINIKRIRAFLTFLTLILLGLFFAFPFLWAIIGSLWPDHQPFSASILVDDPFIPTLSNYNTVNALVPLRAMTFRSVQVVILALPLSILISTLGGFAICRLPLRIQNWLVGVSLMALLMPPTVIWLFRFPLYRWSGLIDTPWALIVPALVGGSPLLVLLFYWSFRRIPTEVFEAAVLEGASTWQQWRFIGLPLVRNMVFGAAMLCFALFWSNYIDPLLYLHSDEYMPLSMAVQRLSGLDMTRWPVILAGSVIFVIPVVMVFFIGQRFLQQSWDLTEKKAPD
jgi:multiple sugar transport system permease protein